MNKSNIKLVLLRLHTVFMIVLIALAVLMAVGLAAGIRPRILITSSMEPSILKNSLVLVDISAPFESVSEGQVIAFRAGSTEVLHRVSEVNDDGSLIAVPDKGIGEAIVHKADYVGREVITFPFIGGWLRGMLNHIWIVITIAAVLILAGCLPYEKKNAGRSGSAQEETSRSCLSSHDPHII